jgi:Plant transposon protein
MLPYGLSFNSQDELSQLSEGTVRVAMREFVLIIIRTFEKDYLRLLDRAEAPFLLADMENGGFPGCTMSHDCTHIQWSNCPLLFKANTETRTETAL